MKYNASTENLQKYHHQGWHFFTRVVRKNERAHKYITIRKKGKEKSLGPYNDETWRIIEEIIARAIDKKTENPEIKDGLIKITDITADDKSSNYDDDKQSNGNIDQEKNIEKYLTNLAKDRASLKVQNCMHRTDDGFCEFWVYKDELPEYLKNMYEHYKIDNYSKVKNCANGEKEFRLRAFDTYCSGCEEYRRKNTPLDDEERPHDLPRVSRETEELVRAVDDIKTYEGVIGFDPQARILASMGLSWFVKGIYDQEKGGESLIQFIERNIIEHYQSRGWNFLRKDTIKVLKMNGSLRSKMKGHIHSIRTPGFTKTIFPKEADHFFGVHYGSDDDETFEIIGKMLVPWIPYDLYGSEKEEL